MIKVQINNLQIKIIKKINILMVKRKKKVYNFDWSINNRNLNIEKYNTVK